jgi:hypothetical protein
MTAGVFDHTGVPLLTEVWTKLYGFQTMVILKLSEMGDRRLIFVTNSDNKRKCLNPTITGYLALLSRLTIKDVLISLERFGEAKDEGRLAICLRGLPLADSPVQAKCILARAHNC